MSTFAFTTTTTTHINWPDWPIPVLSEVSEGTLGRMIEISIFWQEYRPRRFSEFYRVFGNLSLHPICSDVTFTTNGMKAFTFVFIGEHGNTTGKWYVTSDAWLFESDIEAPGLMTQMRRYLDKVAGVQSKGIIDAGRSVHGYGPVPTALERGGYQKINLGTHYQLLDQLMYGEYPRLYDGRLFPAQIPEQGELPSTPEVTSFVALLTSIPAEQKRATFVAWTCSAMNKICGNELRVPEEAFLLLTQCVRGLYTNQYKLVQDKLAHLYVPLSAAGFTWRFNELDVSPEHITADSVQRAITEMATAVERLRAEQAAAAERYRAEQAAAAERLRVEQERYRAEQAAAAERLRVEQERYRAEQAAAAEIRRADQSPESKMIQAFLDDLLTNPTAYQINFPCKKYRVLSSKLLTPSDDIEIIYGTGTWDHITLEREYLGPTVNGNTVTSVTRGCVTIIRIQPALVAAPASVAAGASTATARAAAAAARAEAEAALARAAALEEAAAAAEAAEAASQAH